MAKPKSKSAKQQQETAGERWMREVEEAEAKMGGGIIAGRLPEDREVDKPKE